MIKNYLKIAWRNVLKNKTSSIINIGGLAVGMAVAMLIGLWIWDELSYDKYHDNYGKIAQVMQQRVMSGEIHTTAAIPLPLDDAMRKNYGSDFGRIVMSTLTWPHILTTGEKKISYPGNYMSAEAPDLFTLKMLKGSRNSLDGTTSMLLSASAAKALFGSTDPVNQLIKLDNEASFKVTGVYEDLPENTTLHDIGFIAPWAYFKTSEDWLQRAATDWGDNSFLMYVQIADNADMTKLSAKIKDIKLKNIDKEDAKYKPQMFLHPMSKWHLHSEFKNGVNTGGAIQYVWLFGIIGVFVLLLACINFMNLSTARSEKRAKEVGIRKAVGSLRGQLISQFFYESVLMAVISLGVSLSLINLALPLFNDIAGKHISVLWSNPTFWLAVSCFTLFTGIVAGSYPALYLSSFNPVKVLKGAMNTGRFASLPRRVLVVVQFSVSVVLIIGTIVIFKQVQFAKSRPVGYSRAGLVSVPTQTTDLITNFMSVKNDLLSTGAVTDVSMSSSPLTASNNSRGDVNWSGKDPGMSVDFNNVRISTAYGKTIGWKMTDGRDFSEQFTSDSTAVILNQAAVKYMGLKQPVGEIVKIGKRDFKVIGVAKDMVMESPYEPVKQTVFYLDKDGFDYVNIRINPNVSTHQALAKIEEVCKRYAPSVPFTYKFVDDAYANKFNTEERVGKLAGVFASLAIFISCLGLFGMASYMAARREKELGVRKVLGASVLNLWQLLSSDFVRLIIISLLIAVPISYYLMNNWLLHFAYRAQLSWWIFVVTGVGAILITLLTVSYQSLKAAMINPVKSLKTE